MIRVIVKRVFCGPEGQTLKTDFQTFDVDQPLLEYELRRDETYVDRSVIGAELLRQKGPL